ncbi:hypothetical protein B0H19DRAFT_1079628 [Mycena capillaripes]|nr:hypothetical protein B0H19DRAFT_1079628 [Mycena capillaripes]
MIFGFNLPDTYKKLWLAGGIWQIKEERRSEETFIAYKDAWRFWVSGRYAFIKCFLAGGAEFQLFTAYGKSRHPHWRPTPSCYKDYSTFAPDIEACCWERTDGLADFATDIATLLTITGVVPTFVTSLLRLSSLIFADLCDFDFSDFLTKFVPIKVTKIRKLSELKRSNKVTKLAWTPIAVIVELQVHRFC